MFGQEAESAGGGLLQGFRRKIVKYAPSPQPPLQLQSPRSPETLGGGAFVMLVKRFDEHDELLRQLESVLLVMLQQLQVRRLHSVWVACSLQASDLRCCCRLRARP